MTLAVPGTVPGHGPAEHARARSLALPGVREAQLIAHEAAVSANWAAFHVGVPRGFASYAYRYRDGLGELLYVGMTSAAVRRANAHWERSDWRSWVMSAEYIRCHNRDEAFQLETKIRRDEHPLFVKVTGNAALIAELDGRYLINHVTGQCYCNDPELTGEILDGTPVVESLQPDPSGWM